MSSFKTENLPESYLQEANFYTVSILYNNIVSQNLLLNIYYNLLKNEGAMSEEVTAYTKLHEVECECNEVDFAKAHIEGFQDEWRQHLYFEFTKQEYIKPHQRVIVMKKASGHDYNCHFGNYRNIMHNSNNIIIIIL